jgi:hypothetical protein
VTLRASCPQGESGVSGVQTTMSSQASGVRTPQILTNIIPVHIAITYKLVFPLYYTYR